MVKCTAVPDAQDPEREDSGARTLVLAAGSGGQGISTVAINISHELSAQGKRVCLLDMTDSGTPARDDVTQRADQGSDRIGGVAAETPGDIPVLSLGSSFTNFLFLDKARQVILVETLQRLEADYDFLIVDSSGDDIVHPLPLLLAAPQLLLITTPGAASQLAAFSLLKSLKRHYFEQPVHVIVNRAADLPDAHDSFRRFRRATMRYLQMEVRYLGYLLADSKISRVAPNAVQSGTMRSNSVAFRCLESISGRILQLLPPRPGEEGLSRYLETLLSEPPDETASWPAPKAGSRENNAIISSRAAAASQTDQDGLQTAWHYANLLGKQDQGKR